MFSSYWAFSSIIDALVLVEDILSVEYIRCVTLVGCFLTKEEFMISFGKMLLLTLRSDQYNSFMGVSPLVWIIVWIHQELREDLSNTQRENFY